MAIMKTRNGLAEKLPQLLAVWVIPFIISVSYCLLASIQDFRLSIGALAVLTALITICLPATLYLCCKTKASLSPVSILVLASFIRLLFVFHPPSLSDDIYRYAWDGLTVLRGDNPYAMAPADSSPWGMESADLLKLVNHSHLGTIYPPAAQLVFATGTFLGGITGIKMLLVIMDLLTCAMIIQILSRVGLPSYSAVVYAWHPLPVIEIAASGHIDGAGIFFLTLAFLLLTWQKDSISRSTITFLAGMAFSLAFLTKLFPILFLPACLIMAGNRRREVFVAGVVTGSAILLFPFLPDIKNMLHTLEIYARNWEFSGFAYQTLRKMTGSGEVTRAILILAFLSFTAFFYAQFFAKIKKRIAGKTRGEIFSQMIKTIYPVTMAFLLLTPTLHPWYALYLACLLPFHTGAGGFVLTWAVFLSYRVLIPFTLLGIWLEDDNIPAIIWLGTVAALLLSAATKAEPAKGDKKSEKFF